MNAVHGNTRHGQSKRGAPHFKEWSIWVGMLKRCDNPNDKNFARYGGRGVTVSPRWRCFEAFFADMGPIPSAVHTLDRIDTNGHYEFGNCRWATQSDQARNRSTTRMVSVYGGRRMCLKAAVERYGVVGYRTVQNRLANGWPLRRALLTPPMPSRHDATRGVTP